MRARLRSFARTMRDREFAWRYGFNLVPSLRYSIDGRSRLREVEKNTLDRLNKDGIAITTIEELMTDRAEFDELTNAVESLLISREDQIAALGASANDSTRIGKKTFNVELLGSELSFDPDVIFARFALNPSLLNIANGYLRMCARLRYYNVWYTFATNGAARESQLWHFDREDNYILKIFVYLKDVELGTGPFTYAPGTHRKGPHWNRKPESFRENNVLRTSDDQMHAVIPRKDWITATGKKGTIVFADTRGYHKGGEARTDDRLMYTCMFTSPASDSKQLMQYRSLNGGHDLTKKQKLALGTGI